MANPNDRSRLLAKFGLTEATLKSLFTNKAPAEAVWLAEHELTMHKEWAEQRHDFLLSEIAKEHPDAVELPKQYRRKQRRAPLPDQPPIVSHRGRSRADIVYGETIG